MLVRKHLVTACVRLLFVFSVHSCFITIVNAEHCGAILCVPVSEVFQLALHCWIALSTYVCTWNDVIAKIVIVVSSGPMECVRIWWLAVQYSLLGLARLANYYMYTCWLCFDLLLCVQVCENYIVECISDIHNHKSIYFKIVCDQPRHYILSPVPCSVRFGFSKVGFIDQLMLFIALNIHTQVCCLLSNTRDLDKSVTRKVLLVVWESVQYTGLYQWSVSGHILYFVANDFCWWPITIFTPLAYIFSPIIFRPEICSYWLGQLIWAVSISNW